MNLIVSCQSHTAQTVIVMMGGDGSLTYCLRALVGLVDLDKI